MCKDPNEKKTVAPLDEGDELCFQAKVAYPWDASAPLRGERGSHFESKRLVPTVLLAVMVIVTALLLVFAILWLPCPSDVPSILLWTAIALCVGFFFCLTATAFYIVRAERDYRLEIIEANKQVQIEWIRANSVKKDVRIARLLWDAEKSGSPVNSVSVTIGEQNERKQKSKFRRT